MDWLAPEFKESGMSSCLLLPSCKHMLYSKSTTRPVNIVIQVQASRHVTSWDYLCASLRRSACEGGVFVLVVPLVVLVFGGGGCLCFCFFCGFCRWFFCDVKHASLSLGVQSSASARLTTGVFTRRGGTRGSGPCPPFLPWTGGKLLGRLCGAVWSGVQVLVQL